MKRNGRGAPTATVRAAAEMNTATAKRRVHGDPSADDRQLLVATAVLLAPSGRRQLAVLVVARCPHGCGGVHLHRGQPGIRQAGCGKGEYKVIAVRRWRS